MQFPTEQLKDQASTPFLDLFEQGDFNDVIQGPSGRDFAVTISERAVLISDELEFQHFSADVNESGTLHFSVYNEMYQGEKGARNPDIFAFKLLERTVQYFEERGHEVKCIESEWSAHKENDEYLSDNYAEFIEYLRLLNRAITHDDLVEAAKQTWTGKACKKLKYEIVKEVDIKTLDGSKIPVVFAKFVKKTEADDAKN